MHIVIVYLRAHEHAIPAFEAALLANAAASRTEPGCLQFDVCRADDGSYCLYEVYTDAQAFQAHLKTTHFRSFVSQSATWVAEKRASSFTRISP